MQLSRGSQVIVVMLNVLLDFLEDICAFVHHLCVITIFLQWRLRCGIRTGMVGTSIRKVFVNWRDGRRVCRSIHLFEVILVSIDCVIITALSNSLSIS